MASEKQVSANRRNATKGTGEKMNNGKLQSRCNAMRLGLTAGPVVPAIENAEEFQRFEVGMRADYQPVSLIEHELPIATEVGKEFVEIEAAPRFQSIYVLRPLARLWSRTPGPPPFSSMNSASRRKVNPKHKPGDVLQAVATKSFVVPAPGVSDDTCKVGLLRRPA